MKRGAGIGILATIVLFVLALTLGGLQPVNAQDVIPRFERTPCDYPVPMPLSPDIQRQCGYLVVPQNRARPNTRTFRLAVVIYPAREPDGSPPLLLLHGGPDGAGGTRVPWGAVMQFPLVRRRDVVSFDMRGVSASEPDVCPDFEEKAAPAFLLPTREEWEQAYRAVVRACVATLEAQGLDRSAFGADVNAQDAMDLRHALGYSSWDVYGVSHGGLVAQELMRRDPRGTHAAALESAPAPGDYASEWALSYQRLLHYVFTECGSQPDCRMAFPTLEQDFYSLYEELSARPHTVAVDGSRVQSVRVSGEHFLMYLRRWMGTPENSRLPLLLNELRRGDRDGAFRRLVGDGRIAPWGPLGRLVQCNEYGAVYRSDIAAMKPLFRAPFLTIADDFREHCDQWLPNPTHSSDPRPIVSDIPTLVTHGQYEGSTDVEATQRKITAALTRAYAYTFPGEGHAGAPSGCHGSIVQQFLENPTREPDAACIARMSPVKFRAAGFEPILRLVITAPNGAASPFTGTWEATLGGAPDWTMDLEVDGAVVRGTVLERLLPVSEGHVDGSSLSFRVRSPDGQRTITFTGRLQGDGLQFTRTVELMPGGGPGRRGIFGVQGPDAFEARKVR
jgi:pimeloyl-ACP methyl ester carboxylesterase